MEKVAVLSRELSQSVGASEHVSGELEGLRRRIQELDGEKRMLEDRLENNKMLVMESRKEGQEMEKQLAELRHKLGEAESGRKTAERRLAQAGTNHGADNYLKDELNKTRKENVSLQEKTKELE